MAVAALVVRANAITGELEKSFSTLSRSAQKFERDFQNTASSVSAQQNRITKAFESFSGDRLAREASAVAKAVEQIGGASKLTAREQAQVNAVVSDAIAKYQALGQTAPKALIDLEQATRRVETATASLKQPTSIFANSLKDLEERGAGSSKVMGLLSSTFGQFTAAGVVVGIINRLGGELSNLISRGTQVAGLQQSFDRLAAGVGQNSDRMLGSMRSATRGLVQGFDLMQSANKALLLGLPVTGESMEELARISTTLGKAMGQDATKSLDDFITALGRSSPLILDNLGITVKVEEANQKYAASLGKTSDALTDAERKMAFYVEALRKGREKTAEIGQQTLTLTEQIKAGWNVVADSVTNAVGKINQAAGELTANSAKSASDVGGFFSSIAQNGLRATLAARLFNEQMASVARAASTQAAAPTIIPESLPARVKRLTEDLSHLTAEQKKTIEAGRQLGANTADIVKELNRLGGAVKFTEEHLALLNSSTKEEAKSLKDTSRVMEMVANARREDARFAQAQKTATDLLAEAMKDFNHDLASQQLIFVSLIAPAKNWREELEHLFDTASQAIPALQRSVEEMAKAQNEGRRILALAQKAFDDALQVGLNFGSRIADTIIGSFQGGGDALQAVGSFIGAEIGKTAGAALAKTLAKTLGESIGGAIGGALGPLGALGGSLIGKLISSIGGPSQEELLGRQIVESFEQQLQGGLTAAQKLAEGNESWKLTTIAVRDAYVAAGRTAAEAEAAVAKLWASSRSGADASRIAVLEIQAVMDIAAEKQKTLGQEIDNQAKATDAASSALLGRIQDLTSQYNTLFKSIENEAPEEEMGILERRTRDAMDAIQREITDVSKNGLGQLGDSAAQTALEIQNLFDTVKIKIPIEFVLPDGLKLPGLAGLNVPALGTGGIVREPTLALIGESGPEAVVPLSGAGGVGPSSVPIVTQVYLDGRQIAEATVPHIPRVVRRRT